MKRLYSIIRHSGPCWAKIQDFLLFLVTPEDSRDGSQWRKNRHRYDCFDTWYCGMTKILFWFGCSALIGGGLPLLILIAVG
jgi:hypothetical protein